MKKVLLFLFIIIINTPNLFSQTNLSTNNVTSSNAIVNWDNGGCSSGTYYDTEKMALLGIKIHQ